MSCSVKPFELSTIGRSSNLRSLVSNLTFLLNMPPNDEDQGRPPLGYYRPPFDAFWSGTKELLTRFGPSLLYVRYRYDEDRREHVKTVELVVRRLGHCRVMSRRTSV